MRFTLIAIAGLYAAIAAGQNSSPASRPYTLGKDTTRIESPLLPDGRPDYLTALNQMASKGVTKDSNAAVVLIPAFDDKVLWGDQQAEKVLDELKISLQPKRMIFQGFPGLEKGAGTEAYIAYEEGISRPWRSKNLPALASWLKEHQKPLDMVRDATERTRWYIPLTMTENVPTFMSVQGPQYRPLISAGEALVVRANLAAGEGKTDEAIADLLAVYRLGILLDQDPRLDGRFTAMALTSMAQKVIKVYAITGVLSGRQAQQLAKTLVAIGPLPRVASAVDGLERFGTISGIELISTQPAEQAPRTLGELATLYVIAGAPNPTVDEEFREAWRNVDWEALLRQANARFDSIVNAMTLPSFAQRVDVLEKSGPGNARCVLETQAPSARPQSGHRVAWRAVHPYPHTIILWQEIDV